MYDSAVEKTATPSQFQKWKRTDQPFYDRLNIQAAGPNQFFQGGANKLLTNFTTKLSLPNNQAFILGGISAQVFDDIVSADYYALQRDAWFELKIADRPVFECPLAHILVKPGGAAAVGNLKDDARRLSVPIIIAPGVQVSATITTTSALTVATPVTLILDGHRLAAA
jgi:hypothetical protein